MLRDDGGVEMASYWLWWILAAVLVGTELVTGTFYLLAVGVAFAVGGLAAWLGASTEAQLLLAGVLGAAGVLAAQRWRRRHAASPPAPGFDLGQPVRVQAWNPDGTARVAYRGSLWTAELAAPDVPRGEVMYIVATRGSTLIVADHRPASN
jgi:membrane protein implicated in regulation of membrane protease activity